MEIDAHKRGRLWLRRALESIYNPGPGESWIFPLQTRLPDVRLNRSLWQQIPKNGEVMSTLKWKRLALVLAVGMLALWSIGLASSGQERSDQGQEIKKTDVHGDPLPDGARVRMGTLRWRHPAGITFVGFTSNNKQVVTSCGDGYFRVWDADSGKEIRKFGKSAADMLKAGQAVVQPGGGVLLRAYGYGGGTTLSADGKVLAELAMEGNVRLWDVAGGKEIRTIGKPLDQIVPPGGKGPKRMRVPIGVVSAAFSPNGKVLATAGFDQVIRLWDTGTGKEIRQIGKPPEQGKPGAFPPFIAGLGGNTLAFLPDGKVIVSAGMELDNQMRAAVLRIYDVESGKELRQIKSGQQNLFRASSLAILPKSKSIAWSGMDGAVRLYDADSGKEIRQLGKEQQRVITRTLLFSPDGKIMATQTNNSPAIQLWDVASGKELRKLDERAQGKPGRGAFIGGFGIGGLGGTTVAFSSDSKTLAEATIGNTIRLWKVDTGKEIVPVSSGHHGRINRLAVSADGKVLTTFAGDQTIRQWDMATGKESRLIKLPANADNVGLSGDGKLAAWTNGAQVRLWDVAQSKEIRAIDLPGQGPRPVVFRGIGLFGAPAFSADGKWLAVRGPDEVLRVFDTATGKQSRQLVERNEPAPNPGGGFIPPLAFARTPMALSADGAAFAATSSNAPQFGGFGGGGGGPMVGSGNSLRMWNLTQGKNPRLFETEKKAILELAVTPDGQRVVTANADSTISMWEALTGKECLQIKLSDAGEKPGLQPPVPPPVALRGPGGRLPQANAVTLAISPDGRTLAAGINRIVRLFDLRTGKELGQFKGHQGAVVSVAFAPDNQTVISGSADTTALVWDGSRFIKKPATIDLQAQQVDDLWKDLAADPVKAYQAIGKLSAAPKQAVALVKEKIKPTAHGDEKRIEQLINDLESDQFQVRQKATKELEKLGDLAEPALQKSLQTLKALEAKRRVEKLLGQIADDQTPSAQVLRNLRAVQVLGQIGNRAARTELERLAKGAPGDKLTRSAETALKRMNSK